MNGTNIVAIGRGDFLPGFGLAGIRTIATDAAGLKEAVRREEDAAIAVVDGTLYAQLPRADQDAFAMSTRPIVIVMAIDVAAERDRIDRMVRSTMGIDPGMVIMRKGGDA